MLIFPFRTANYLERVEEARLSEERQIEEIPSGEREEVRQIFAAKGFSGETLERIVEVITNDRRLWVDTMLAEELGLEVEGPNPYRAAIATFVAFLVVGIIPLVPFLLPDLLTSIRFLASAVATAVAFFSVGAAKGLILSRSALRSGLGTLLTGGTAAAIAFVVGALLQKAFGTA